MLRSTSYAGQASFAQSIAGKISETLVEDIVAKRSSPERSLVGARGLEPIGVRATSRLFRTLRFRRPQAKLAVCFHYGETPVSPTPFTRFNSFAKLSRIFHSTCGRLKNLVVGARGLEPIGVRATSRLFRTLRFRRPQAKLAVCFHYGETPVSPTPFTRFNSFAKLSRIFHSTCGRLKNLVVGARGFEPPRDCSHSDLNAACIPVSPRAPIKMLIGLAQPTPQRLRRAAFAIYFGMASSLLLFNFYKR